MTKQTNGRSLVGWDESEKRIYNLFVRVLRYSALLMGVMDTSPLPGMSIISVISEDDKRRTDDVKRFGPRVADPGVTS